MIKRIMTTGVVSAALAAATLLTQTASAAPESASYRQDIRSHQSNPARPGTGHQPGANSGHGSYGTPGSHGTTNWPRPSTQSGPSSGWHTVSFTERRTAVETCSRAIQSRTDHAFPGPFGQAQYNGQPRVERVGPRDGAIRVSAPVKVSGRFQAAVTPSNCVVRQGRVVDLDYAPDRLRQQLMPQRQSFGWNWWSHR